MSGGEVDEEKKKNVAEGNDGEGESDDGDGITHQVTNTGQARCVRRGIASALAMIRTSLRLSFQG